MAETQLTKARADSGCGEAPAIPLIAISENLRDALLWLYRRVMSHARADYEDAIVNSKDKSVGLVDSDAPPSREITFERLGLADARIAVAINALNERVDSLERLAVARRPVL